jgi:transcription elongation GreA/GreB family factor
VGEGELSEGVAATSGSLMAAARAGDLDDFEAVWLEALADPGPAEGFLAALAALPDGLRGGSAVSLLTLLLEAFEQRERRADVLTVARALHAHRQQKLDLGQSVRKALDGLHGGEEWFGVFVELADLDGGGDLVEALDRFERLTRFLPGLAVYHRSGWGEGVVLQHDLARREMSVRFREDGMVRPMPFTTALDVLSALDPSDLRSRLLVDVEGLIEEARRSPELLIRSVARLHKGRATVKEIKHWLQGPVIEERSWASWWKKAKVAAGRDPYLAVENPARPVFVLRERALTPAQETRDALQRAGSLADLLAVVRGPLSLDPDAEVRTLMLDELVSRLDGDRDPVARLEAALLLVRHGHRPASLAAEVADAVVSSTGGFAGVVEKLPEAGLRREALAAFVEARPQLWSDTLVNELPTLSGQLLDVVCDRLVGEGRADAVANRFHIYLLSPSRHAAAVLRLARRFAAGLLEGVEEAPDLHDVVMGLLHLGETQAPLAARGDKRAKEIMRQLAEVLLEYRGGLLSTFAGTGGRSELGAAMSVVARCRQMPDEIVTGLSRAVHVRFPELVPQEQIPFWEGTGIFCTRAGLARRREQYRVLTQEKIPENSADIGRAASYGDLSENYEWAAAIEQQRHLTEKAAAMEAELKLAQALEDQELDAGLVCPGTRVHYEQGGEQRSIRILGPWDEGDDVVSYRAPLAAGMLGAREGETVTLTLPSGSVEVTVRRVESAL